MKQKDIDNILKANKKLDWVKRLYEKDTPSIVLPGQEYPSTHYMESSDNLVYPTIIRNADGKLEYLGNKARDYAIKTNTAIKLSSEEDANWFGENYKKGTNVLKQFKKGGKVEPIYTDNPKDKRLKAYNDSLSLYKIGEKLANPRNMGTPQEFDFLNAHRGQSIGTSNNSFATSLRFEKPVQPVIYKKEIKVPVPKKKFTFPDEQVEQSNIVNENYKVPEVNQQQGNPLPDYLTQTVKTPNGMKTYKRKDRNSAWVEQYKNGGKITAETIYSMNKQPKAILTPNDIYAKDGANIDLSNTVGDRKVFSLEEFKNIVPDYQYQGYLNSGKEGLYKNINKLKYPVQIDTLPDGSVTYRPYSYESAETSYEDYKKLSQSDQPIKATPITGFKNGGKVEPIYTDNPKDKRLKAYNDSLSLYKIGEKNFNEKLNNFRGEKFITPSNKDIQGLKKHLGKILPKEILTKEMQEPYSTTTFGRYKKPVQPVIYKKKIEEEKKSNNSKIEPIYVDNPNDKRLQAYNDSLALSKYTHNTLKWDANDAGMKAFINLEKLNGVLPSAKNNDKYKKPVQPIIYKKKEEVKVPIPKKKFTFPDEQVEQSNIVDENYRVPEQGQRKPLPDYLIQTVKTPNGMKTYKRKDTNSPWIEQDFEKGGIVQAWVQKFTNGGMAAQQNYLDLNRINNENMEKAGQTSSSGSAGGGMMGGSGMMGGGGMDMFSGMFKAMKQSIDNKKLEGRNKKQKEVNLHNATINPYINSYQQFDDPNQMSQANNQINNSTPEMTWDNEEGDNTATKSKFDTFTMQMGKPGTAGAMLDQIGDMAYQSSQQASQAMNMMGGQSGGGQGGGMDMSQMMSMFKKKYGGYIADGGYNASYMDFMNTNQSLKGQLPSYLSNAQVNTNQISSQNYLNNVTPMQTKGTQSLTNNTTQRVSATPNKSMMGADGKQASGATPKGNGLTSSIGGVFSKVDEGVQSLYDGVGAMTDADSGAGAWFQGGAKAGQIAGKYTEGLKNIPVYGEIIAAAIDSVARFTGGALNVRDRQEYNKMKDRQDKVDEYKSRQAPLVYDPNKKGQYMAKYGANPKMMEQRIIDDIYSDFDKHFKLK